VDCLLLLCKQDRRPQDELPPSALILVVDDDPVSRKTLRTALGKAHLKAVALGDPELALKVLAENRFDLVFSDVNMPGMNGYDFCKALRAQPTNKTTPVVFVTSASDLESRAQSTISGGNDFIIKPFPMIEMAVKALTFIVQPKVNAAPAPAPAPVSGAAPAVAVAA
jgi:PleD family two-component response regulator